MRAARTKHHERDFRSESECLDQRLAFEACDANVTIEPTADKERESGTDEGQLALSCRIGERSELVEDVKT